MTTQCTRCLKPFVCQTKRLTKSTIVWIFQHKQKRGQNENYWCSFLCMKQAQWYSRRETFVLEFSHNPQPISTENTENLLRIKWQFRLNSKLSALTLMTIINYLAGTSHAPFFTFTPSFKITPPPPLVALVLLVQRTPIYISVCTPPGPQEILPPLLTK